MEQKKHKIGYIIFMFAVCLWSVFLFAACQTHPTWQEQYNLGMRYLTESNYEEAILAFTSAIEIDPNQPQAYIGRADAYLQMTDGVAAENLQAAQADYQQALTLDDSLEEAYIGLVSVYEKQADWERLVAVLQSGIEKTGAESLKTHLEELEQTFELTNYIRTNIYDFVEKFGGLHQGDASDGSIVFENDEITVSTMYGYGDESHGIVGASVIGNSPFSIFGIRYGTSVEEASQTISALGGTPLSEGLGDRTYELSMGETVSFSTQDGTTVDSITYYLDLYAANLL